MLTARRLYWPSVNLIGPGCIQEIGQEVKKITRSKILLVTDPTLLQLGVVKKVTAILDAEKIDYVIFSDVKPNPTTQNVYDGLKMYREHACDGLISVGGGSPQDAAKAIGILSTNGGKITDYEGINKSVHKSAPIIAINTTAGTASEVTVNYVITDEERKIKMVMVDPNSLAVVAVNDPELMLNKPPGLTAATGMDALTHAIEAYVAAGSFELTDSLAYQAIRFISRSLREAVKNGSNLQARSEMAWGSYVAGLAFSNCGLGIVHSMAHQLGSEYDLPHGVANAILLPYVMEYNLDARPAKFAKIAEAMNLDISSATSVREAAHLALDEVKALSKDVGIPPLKETGFHPDDIGKLARQAMQDVCTGGNPKPVTEQDIMDLYMKAYRAE